MNGIAGVLGSSGTIGHYVTQKLLDNGVEVIGGQRRKNKYFENKNGFKWLQTDVSDPDSLKGFCKQCDAVVNCISPAYIYGKLVAEAAAECGAAYIDGVDIINKESKLPEDGVYVISGGYVPGLSEYLPYVLSKKEFDTFEKGVIYQGGTELCSDQAFADIVLSAGISGYGDAYYNDGAVRPFRSMMSRRYRLSGFNKEVMLKSYLGNEMLHLGKRINARKLYWFNAYEDMRIIKLLMESLRASAGKEKEQAADIIKKYIGDARKDFYVNDDTQPYAVLGMELSGKKDGRDKIIECVLHLKNSSRLCGFMLGETALAVLKKRPQSGFYCAYEMIDEEYMDRLVHELSEGEQLSIREISKEGSIIFDIDVPIKSSRFNWDINSFAHTLTDTAVMSTKSS